MRPHWQLYKKLECIPEEIPDLPAETKVFTFPLREAWKILMNVLAQELVHEQQIEFLERCLSQDIPNFENLNNFWVKLWKLLD